MTKSNEKKLLKAIAKVNYENEAFMKKYGIKTDKTKMMLKPFEESDTCPS